MCHMKVFEKCIFTTIFHLKSVSMSTICPYIQLKTFCLQPLQFHFLPWQENANTKWAFLNLCQQNDNLNYQKKCWCKIGFSQFSLENGNLHQKNGNLPLQKYFSWFFFYCIIIWFCNLKRKCFASAAKILPVPASNLAIHLGIYVNICMLTQIARVALITKISHPFVGIFVNTAFIL